MFLERAFSTFHFQHGCDFEIEFDLFTQFFHANSVALQCVHHFGLFGRNQVAKRQFDFERGHDFRDDFERQIFRLLAVVTEHDCGLIMSYGFRPQRDPWPGLLGFVELLS